MELNETETVTKSDTGTKSLETEEKFPQLEEIAIPGIFGPGLPRQSYSEYRNKADQAAEKFLNELSDEIKIEIEESSLHI